MGLDHGTSAGYIPLSCSFGEVTELVEGARLEIVCGPKAHQGFESLPLRQKPLRSLFQCFVYRFEIGVTRALGWR